jgi:hypothetical protein
MRLVSFLSSNHPVPQPGDIMETEIEGIGVLRNPIVSADSIPEQQS